MKINYKKALRIASITSFNILLVLIGSGCSKSYLDVPPQGQQKAVKFWVSASDATKGVDAIYANLRSWPNVAFAPIAVESLGSDDAEKGSDPSDAAYMNDFDGFTATSTEGQLSDFWNGQYQNINLCNQVLDNVPNITMDATFKLATWQRQSL